MTRKHFEAIAATIKETKLSSMDRVVFSNRMADTLAETNPRFNRALFLEACGVDARYVHNRPKVTF
jgi:hypothetical protein